MRPDVMVTSAADRLERRALVEPSSAGVASLAEPRRPLESRLGALLLNWYVIAVFVVVPLFERKTSLEGTPRGMTPVLFLSITMLVTAFTTHRLPKLTKPVLALFVFYSALIMSCFRSADGALEALRALGTQAGMSIAALLVIRDWVSLRRVRSVLFWCAAVNAVYGLIFAIPGLDTLVVALWDGGFPVGISVGSPRLTGLLRDPSNVGLLLGCGVLIGAERIYAHRRGRDWLVVGAIALAVALTFSRTAWAALAVGLIVWTLRRPVAVRRRLIVYGIAAIGILILVVGFGLRERVEENQYRLHVRDSDTRSVVWRAWLNVARREPLGLGFGAVDRMRSQLVMADSAFELSSTHNFYLTVWIEAGAPALAALVMTVLLCGAHCMKVHEGVPGRLDADTVLAMLALMVVGLFALNYMTQLLFLTLAIANNIGEFPVIRRDK